MVADYLVTKCGVLMMSLFVFFTTTMSVSFTLRETQTRMLKFTGLLTELDVKYDHDPKSYIVFAGLRPRSHPFSQSDSQIGFSHTFILLFFFTLKNKKLLIREKTSSLLEMINRSY